MADYEARFSALRRYAPHIFDNPHRKLKKFMDGLKGNIRRYVATNDPETFTRALRIAHLAEIENDKFINEQKNAGKRPLLAPTNCQEDKQARKFGQFRAQPTPQISQFAQLVIVNMLARNADGAATDVSIVEK